MTPVARACVSYHEPIDRNYHEQHRDDELLLAALQPASRMPKLSVCPWMSGGSCWLVTMR